MKYNTQEHPEISETSFIVTIGDVEYATLENNKKLRRFEEIILSRLANIIVGWMFKHHKDELIKPLLNNVVERVGREVSREILSRLGLPLEGNYDQKTK